MEPLIPLARGTEFTPKTEQQSPAAQRQLDLVLGDGRLRDMTPVERQAALRSLAHLLLEASGVAAREVGDDNE